MSSIIAVTLPIFLIVALGYGAARRGLFEPDHTRALGRFVINFAIPALIFRALTQAPFDEVMNVRYLAAYALAAFTLMVLGIAYALLVRRKRLTMAALYGMGMSGSNSAMIGFPIVFQFLGPPATIALALNMIVENLLMIPAGLSVAELGEGKRASLGGVLLRTFVNLAKTPLILAITAGMIASLLDFHLPIPIEQAINMLAGASAPVALFVIGASLKGLKLGGMAKDIIDIGVAKLFLHPVFLFVAITLVGLQEPELRKAALIYACAPMMSVLPVLGLKYGEEGVWSAALLATTAASFFTVSAMLWAISHGWVG
jgi:malonate transporter and related proteins